MEIISDAQEIRTRLEQFQANKDPKLKNTMSVPEMRRLLGLKKTERATGLSTEIFLRQESLTAGCGWIWRALRNGMQTR